MSKFKRFISTVVLTLLVLQTAPFNGLFSFEDVKSSVKTYAMPLFANPSDVSTSTSSATPQVSESDKLTIEGYVSPDFSLPKEKDSFLRSDFKVEAYEGTYETSTIKSSAITDGSGFFKITNFNPNYGFKLRISKDGYLTRDYTSAINIINGQIEIGSLNSPELICSGDMLTVDSNNDGIKDKGDNAINMTDIMQIASMFNMPIDANKKYLDLNADGYINMSDIMIVAKSFNKTNSSYPTSVNGILLDTDSYSKDLILDNTSLDLNGKNLSIGSNLVFRSTQSNYLNINGGTLNITNCLNFGEKKIEGNPLQNPKLIMTNEADYIKVGGNFVFATDICHEGLLTAGTVEVMDNFNVNEASNSKAFYATGTHKVILSKPNYSQNINLGKDPTAQNRINTIILTRPNTIDNYVFQPKQCWNKLVDATENNVNIVMDGSIDFGGDVDTFWFTPKSSQTYNIKSTGDTDTYLELYDYKGNLIAENDDGLRDTNFDLNIPLTEKETYKLSVTHFDRALGTGAYKVIISDMPLKPLGTYDCYLEDLASEVAGTFLKTSDKSATVTINDVTKVFDDSNSKVINNQIVVSLQTFKDAFIDVLPTPAKIVPSPTPSTQMASSSEDVNFMAPSYVFPTAPKGVTKVPSYQIKEVKKWEDDVDNIKNLQELLIKMGCWYDSSIRKSKQGVSGIYAETTTYSVRYFQAYYMNKASKDEVYAETALQLSKYNFMYHLYSDKAFKDGKVKVREYLAKWANIDNNEPGIAYDGNKIGFDGTYVTLNGKQLFIWGLNYYSDERKCYAHIEEIEKAVVNYFNNLPNPNVIESKPFVLSGKDVVFNNPHLTWKYIGEEGDKGLKHDENIMTFMGQIYIPYKSIAKDYLKGNDKLNFTPEQVAFLSIYDQYGAKLYLTAKADSEFNKKVFKILYFKTPQYYCWIQGEWKETSDWTTGCSEADLILTYRNEPINLIEAVTLGLIGVTAIVGVGEVSLLIEGIGSFGWINAIGLYNAGLLQTSLNTIQGISQEEMVIYQQIVESELPEIGAAETQAELNTIREEINTELKLCRNGYCFTGDTLVSTQKGLKEIKDIQVGDEVYSQNPTTGEKGLKTVKRVYINETNVLTYVFAGGTEIKATPTHRYWVVGKGWTYAKDIAIGDKLQYYNGNTVVVTSIKEELLKEKINVYNLEVEDWHTYFVSKDSIWVHNEGCDVNELELAGKVIVEDAIPAQNEASQLINDLNLSPKTAASNGTTNTLSGWGSISKGAEKFNRSITPQTVMNKCNQIGHELGIKSVEDQGIPGQFYASHAEKQLSLLTDESIGVSKAMCDDCIAYYQKLAQYENIQRIVTDPNITRIFMPDGTIITIPLG